MATIPADRAGAIPAGTRQDLRATRIAPRAIEALRAGSGWKILSSHKHAVNFVDPTGRLLSLTQDRIRMGPFSIEVESTPAGKLFDNQTDTLPIGLEEETQVFLAGRAIDLDSAEIWNPRPDWSALAGIRWQSGFLPLLLARLRASAPSESLACVLLQLPGPHQASPGDGHVLRPLKREFLLQALPQATAANVAIRLVQGLAEDDLGGAASASTALAGMGPGLTPSGDDFLIGVMFGVQSALPGARAKALSRVMCRASAGRTNRISQAWLSAAAEGEAVQAWHDLVDSIQRRDDVKVDRASQSLIELGHTSGADALAGFAAYHLARTHSSRT